jgi:hypothetical protein
MKIIVYDLIINKDSDKIKYNIKNNEKIKRKIINRRISDSYIKGEKINDENNLCLSFDDIVNVSKSFDEKNVYFYKTIHFQIKNYWHKQKFLLMFNKHWIQKEESIRYIINLLFLTAGLIFAYMNLK